MRRQRQFMIQYFSQSIKQYIKKLIKGKSDDDNHFENPYLIL